MSDIEEGYESDFISQPVNMSELLNLEPKPRKSKITKRIGTKKPIQKKSTKTENKTKKPKAKPRSKKITSKEWDQILKLNPSKEFTFVQLKKFLVKGTELIVSWHDSGIWIGAEVSTVYQRRRRRGNNSSTQQINFSCNVYTKQDDGYTLDNLDMKVSCYKGKVNPENFGFRFLTSEEKVKLTEANRMICDYKISCPKDRIRYGHQSIFLVPRQMGLSLRHQSGIFVIDREAYNNWSGERSTRKKSQRELILDITVGETVEINDEKLWMLSPLMISYHLPSRTWGYVDITSTTVPVYTNEAWKNLVVDQKTKDTIEGIIRCVDPTSDVASDFVANKGVGLNLLFHGETGCGKTLAAQAIASLHQKAIFNISAGDLGSNIESVEQQLSFISNIVCRWEIYIQIDECDLFIGNRDLSSLVLNELLCCFLRFLESHATIVFLTTNMKIIDIDKAIASRINIFVEFPHLHLAERQLIWNNLLTLYGVDAKDIETITKQFTHLDLNGRHVRNLLYVARGISKSENRETITLSDIERSLPLSVLDYITITKNAAAHMFC